MTGILNIHDFSQILNVPEALEKNYTNISIAIILYNIIIVTFMCYWSVIFMRTS